MTEPVTLSRPKLTYPEPICEHIALAEFDIDAGSVVKHQHPIPFGISTTQLAELMLPEGVHARSRDFCIFTVPRVLSSPASLGIASSSGIESTKSKSKKIPPTLKKGDLICLNMISTRLDKNVRRGALVRALAIASPYHILDAFKRVMIRVMEIIYDSPPTVHDEVLRRVYAALNVMDLSAFAKPSPLFSAYLFTRSEYPVRVEHSDYADKATTTGSNVDPAFEFDSPMSASVGNAVVNTAAATIASGTALPLSLLATRDVPVTLDWTGLIGTESTKEASQSSTDLETEAKQQGEPSTTMPVLEPVARMLERFQVTLPLLLAPNEILGASITSLVNCFKQSTMIIYNAILSNRRVLFLGHQLPVAQIVQMVLSACLLVSIPEALLEVPSAKSVASFRTLVGSIAARRKINLAKAVRRHRKFEKEQKLDAEADKKEQGIALDKLNLDLLRRCYPYASLTDMTFLDNPLGYIAGVANPLFAQREAWWDVLCDLNTGEVQISTHYMDYERSVVQAAQSTLNELNRGQIAVISPSQSIPSTPNDVSSTRLQAPGHPEVTSQILAPQTSDSIQTPDAQTSDDAAGFASSMMNLIAESLSPIAPEDTTDAAKASSASIPIDALSPAMGSISVPTTLSTLSPDWNKSGPDSPAKLIALCFHCRRLFPIATLNMHDNMFIAQILQGVNSGYGEQFLRDAFRELTASLIEVVPGTSSFADENQRAYFLAANAKRIAGLIRGASLVATADAAELEYALTSPPESDDFKNSLGEGGVDESDDEDSVPTNLLFGDSETTSDAEAGRTTQTPLLTKQTTAMVAPVSEADLLRDATPTAELTNFCSDAARASQSAAIPLPNELRAAKRAITFLRSLAALDPIEYTIHLRTLLVLLHSRSTDTHATIETPSTPGIVHYLLALLPPYSGGLDCIGRLLLHASHEVKQAAFELLVALCKSGAEGRHAVLSGGMNHVYVDTLRRFLHRGARIALRTSHEQLRPLQATMPTSESLSQILDNAAAASEQLARTAESR